jgi:hypothetical protein
VSELDRRNRRAVYGADGFGLNPDESEELRKAPIGSAPPPVHAFGTRKDGVPIPIADIEPDPESISGSSGAFVDATILDERRRSTDSVFDDIIPTMVKTTVAEPPFFAPGGARGQQQDNRLARSRRFSEVQFVPRPAVSGEIRPAPTDRVRRWRRLSIAATVIAVVAAAVAIAVVIASRRTPATRNSAKPAATAHAVAKPTGGPQGTAKAKARPAKVPATKTTRPAIAPAAKEPTTPPPAARAAAEAPAVKASDDTAPAERAQATASPSITVVVERPSEAPPGPRNQRQRASAAYEQGVRLFMDGSLDAAETSFRRTLKLDPTHAAAYKGLGLVYRRSGQRRRALVELRTYLKRAPKAKDAAQIRKLIAALEG